MSPGKTRRRPAVRRVGEHALLLEAGSSDAAIAAYHRIREARLADLVDVVPGASTVLVVFDREPAETDRGALTVIESAVAQARIAAPPARVHEVPVSYDGPDLARVAAHASTDVGDVVRRHHQAEYRVAFLGFQPGFAYLSGLPPELAIPRLATPRDRVPAGSVAIGGEWTGIYPADSPGGWSLIGRTDLDLFDVHHDPPARLAPGDAVRFVPR